MTRRETVNALLNAGVIADIDHRFAALLADLDDASNIALLAAVASATHRAGHACLDLGVCAGARVIDFLNWPSQAGGERHALPEAAAEARLPDLPTMLASLRASAVVGGADGAIAPLVLDDERLYLRRLWRTECRLAARLRGLAAADREAPDSETALLRLFPEEDEARAAARRATRRRLAIVTGGPGTGKTTLAARLIALLLECGLARPRRIALASPTGKAAARLQEAVAAQLAAMTEAAPTLRGFTPNAVTIHRLLGGRSPLAADAVIVDECSMVDLALMDRLAAALPCRARLILLGDAAQLASVQPGSVFGDLCAAGARPTSALAGCSATLAKSHRFRAAGGIGRLAAAVADGDADAALAALADAEDDETELRPLPNPAAFDALARQYARDWYAPLMRSLIDGKEPAQAFPRLRVLCAHRAGPFGVNRFNALVERALREQLALPEDDFYVGRPIIVTRNDRNAGLSNGDTGVVRATAEGDRVVWFPDLPGDAFNGTRAIAPSRLPAHESFFALTVHRAQGSEYEQVACVPGPAASRVHSRELLYTALTRARSKVVVYAGADAVYACARRPASRGTGLLARLDEASAGSLSS